MHTYTKLPDTQIHHCLHQRSLAAVFTLRDQFSMAAWTAPALLIISSWIQQPSISVTGWQSVGKALYGSQKPVITLHPYLPWNQVQSKSAGSGLQSTPCYMLWQPHLGLTVQHMIVHCNWSDGKYQHQYNLPHNLNHMLQAASCIWQSRICNQSYIPWYCNQCPMQSINMIVDPNHIDCLYANSKNTIALLRPLVSANITIAAIKGLGRSCNQSIFMGADYFAA